VTAAYPPELPDIYRYAIVKHMKTTLNIDDALLAEAGRLTGITEKTALVRAGLKALIAIERGGLLAQLGGAEHDLRAIPRRRATRRTAL
jgi:Arc/MetJ family transcription regulator